MATHEITALLSDITQGSLSSRLSDGVIELQAGDRASADIKAINNLPPTQQECVPPTNIGCHTMGCRP